MLLKHLLVNLFVTVINSLKVFVSKKSKNLNNGPNVLSIAFW